MTEEVQEEQIRHRHAAGCLASGAIPVDTARSR